MRALDVAELARVLHGDAQRERLDLGQAVDVPREVTTGVPGSTISLAISPSKPSTPPPMARNRQTSRKTVPTKTWKPWKPVMKKKKLAYWGGPYSLRVMLAPST